MVPSGSLMIHSGGRVECSHAGLEVPPGGVAQVLLGQCVIGGAAACVQAEVSSASRLVRTPAMRRRDVGWGAGGGDARRLIVVASAPSGRVMILVGSLQELVPRAGGLA